MLRGYSLILFGDFGQLPPVMDLPLYTTMSCSDIHICTTYHSFNKAVVLDQVMWQHTDEKKGSSPHCHQDQLHDGEPF